MKVLCISAKARHGKDTSAELIKEYLESLGKKVLITHYADLVKFVCTKFFDWDGKKDEKGRSLLQYVGTEVVWNQNPTYWVDFTTSILKFFPDKWDYVLIPDCRYPIEATKIGESFNTTVLRVERPNFESNLTPEQKQHKSETAMDSFDFDAVVYNDSGFDELREKLKIFVDKFLLD